MTKIENAKQILTSLGVLAKQQNNICCCTLLALAKIKENTNWNEATNDWHRIHDIINFCNTNYGTTYAENSREIFRKQALHHFRNAAFIEDNGKATNSPNYRYRLTSQMLHLLQNYGSAEWDVQLKSFQKKHETLIHLYSSKKQIQKIPININGKDFAFSTGKHNLLQKAIIEEFATRFAKDAQVLYIGDTTKRDLYKDTANLKALGFDITLHDKMPDIILHSKQKNWLYFIEAVTSVGAMDAKRVKEINDFTRNVSCGKIYITAFLDFATYKKFSNLLAWDTEVWLAETPDHMIHLNGDKFLGPR